jgi:DNA polymerase sigma
MFDYRDFELRAQRYTNIFKRRRATSKREETNNMDRMTKNVRSMGEHAYTKIVQKYASSVRLPNETPSMAFSRIFCEDSDEGRAIRKLWLLSKGDDNPHDPLNEPDDEDERDDDDSDALDALNALGEQERRRNPKLTKQQAFAKAYADNPALAAKERRQNRPRA